MERENDGAVAAAMCDAAARGDAAAFGQLVEKSPNALYTVDAEGKIPIEYATDADAYGKMVAALLRFCPKIAPPPIRNPSMVTKRSHRAQPRSFRHRIRENAEREKKSPSGASAQITRNKTKQ